MHINFDKTTYIVLGTRYKLRDAQFLNLIIDNHDVKHVSQQKLLLQPISINYVLRFHRKYHFYRNCQHM